MVVALVFWIVVLLTTILNLATTPRLRPRSPQRFPRVSVIVPARDEERTIGRTVGALLAQTYPHLEIIVVNDRSVDATGEVLAGFGDRISVIDGEEPPPGWLGKPWALHQGSRRATGELLLFVDADVIYEPEAVASAVAHMETCAVTLLSLFPRFTMRGFWEHVVVTNLPAFAFMGIPLWASNAGRIVLFAVGGGPGNLVERAAYEAAGGHEALKDAVVDDVGLARLIRRSGHRTAVVRAEAFVSVRMYHGLRETISGFTKNSFAVFGYSYAVALFYLVMSIAFHIVPYVLALTGNVLAWIVIALITLTRIILFAALGYRLDNAIFAHPLMVATWCWILLRSVWFTGIRGKVHWRGRVYEAGRTR